MSHERLLCHCATSRSCPLYAYVARKHSNLNPGPERKHSAPGRLRISQILRIGFEGLQLKYSHKKRRNDCSIRTQKYRSFHCRHGLLGFFITSLEAGIPACAEYCATSRTQIIQFIPVTGEMVSLIGAAKGVVRSAIRELGKTETQPQQQELQMQGSHSSTIQRTGRVSSHGVWRFQSLCSCCCSQVIAI